MTRDEKIEALEELSQFLLEEVQFSSHAHERKMFTGWRSVVEDIRQDMAIERIRGEVHLEGVTVGGRSKEPKERKRRAITTDEWVSVEERLPEESGKYAVSIRNNSGTMFTTEPSCRYDAEHQTWHSNIFGDCTDRVVMWVPNDATWRELTAEEQSHINREAEHD